MQRLYVHLNRFVRKHYALGVGVLLGILLVATIFISRKLLSVDGWLNVVLLALIPFLMGSAGLYLAAEVIDSPKKKIGFIVGFSVLSVLGLVLSVFQQHRSEKAVKAEKAAADKQKVELMTKIDKLSDQVRQLVPLAVASSQDGEIHVLHTELIAGFDRIGKAIESLGAKMPPKTATPQLTPSVVQHIQLAQREVPSQAEGTYRLQAILQTDIEQQGAAFVLTCNGEIESGDFFVAGQTTMMNVRTSVSPDKKQFYFSFGYPPFTPKNPIVVTLVSKRPIHVVKVQRANE